MEHMFDFKKEEVYFCRYQIVWCAKYRRKVLTGPIEARLKELIEEACAELQAGIIKLEVKPEHVNLILEISPRHGLHKAIKHIKAHTSRNLRQEFKELRTKLPTLWSNSYLTATLGGELTGEVERYIQSQKTSQRQ